ncbi:MAG TPA: DUF6599 family protein [Blastocatellia bacterium]|nr:DUF6599 family protein [Blastocatellia bacterium]
MHSKKQISILSAIILMLMAPLAGIAQQAAQQSGAQQAAPQAGAQQAGSGDKQKAGAEVVPLASGTQLVNLLPDSLAGLRATTELKQVGRDNLSDLVGDKAPVYREYYVTSAVSREYGRVRVDVFETQHQLAAFGLFTFDSAADSRNPRELERGSEGVLFDDHLVFYKGRFFVRISDATHRSIHSTLLGYDSPIARALAAEIKSGNPAIARAALLDSLPASGMVADSQRYFLGPESLGSYVEHGRDMFDFAGDTEAVAAQYNQPDDKSAAAGSVAASPQILKIAIVEYHTPQFATDAMTRATGYLSSLPENEQQQIILKRVGNYVVEAVNARDRAMAESLVNSVQYPYTVKWLRNPLWPTNDPFRVQKAAQMLVSTFGLLGLILGTVLVVGSVFGTTIFLKRRKRQQEVFSDAGGMLRLDIDQLETAMLGLPPHRSEE